MRSFWNDYSVPGGATACGWRAMAGRRWPWRKRATSTSLLLDIHMPELDGFQVILALRERSAPPRGPPARHRLDAQVRKKTATAASAAGMDDFPSQADPGRRPVGGDGEAHGFRSAGRPTWHHPASTPFCWPPVEATPPPLNQICQGASGSPAGPFEPQSRRGATGAGHEPAARGRSQALWDGGGVLHRGRCRGVGPRRPGGE